MSIRNLKELTRCTISALNSCYINVSILLFVVWIRICMKRRHVEIDDVLWDTWVYMEVYYNGNMQLVLNYASSIKVVQFVLESINSTNLINTIRCTWSNVLMKIGTQNVIYIIAAEEIHWVLVNFQESWTNIFFLYRTYITIFRLFVLKVFKRLKLSEAILILSFHAH